jgi:hypothetical protein
VLLAPASVQTVEQLTIATNSTTSNSLILSGSATGSDSNQGSQIQFSNTTAGTTYSIRENASGTLDFLNATYSNAFSLPAGATPVIANNGYSATNNTGYSLTNTSGSITSGTTGFGTNFTGTVNDASAVDGIVSFASITCTLCTATSYLADWKVGGTSVFSVDTTGNTRTTGKINLGGALPSGPGVPYISNVITFDDFANTPPNYWTMNQINLAPSGTTTNVIQADNVYLYLSGTATHTGEINLRHTLFDNSVSTATATQVEDHEIQMINNGIIGEWDGDLNIPDNAASGTANAINGSKYQLKNDNTTAASIGSYSSIDMEAMAGAGTRPTNYYFIREADANASTNFLGPMVLGSLTPGGAGTLLTIKGPDTSVSTVAFDVQNSSGTHVIRTFDNGTVAMAGLSTGTNADFLCLQSNGNILIQASACTISSLRFKENVEDHEGSATPVIGKMKIADYNLKDTHNKDPNATSRQTGLIAENIAQVAPECAIYEDDMKTPKSYRQECVIALLVKATQEQAAEIKRLKRRIR